MMSSIKAERVTRGLLAKDVADELGIKPSAYSRWENSQSLPRRVSYAVMYAIDLLDPKGRGHGGRRAGKVAPF